ncbi:hypothetical protein J3F84DRAFT_398815 [Trichoderma pleuroticola]
MGSHLQMLIPLCTTTSERNRNGPREGLNQLLEQLLQVDDELRMWLEYTRYFDLENRKKILYRAKTRREIDQRRAKFLAQVQSATINTLRAPMSSVQHELPPIRCRRSARLSGVTLRSQKAIPAESYDTLGGVDSH